MRFKVAQETIIASIQEAGLAAYPVGDFNILVKDPQGLASRDIELQTRGEQNAFLAALEMQRRLPPDD